MRLPPLRLAWWPLRAGVAAGLASLLVLARHTVLARAGGDGWGWDAERNVLPTPVFATVTAIVCAQQTRGASLQASWAVVGGTTLGCALSALALALLGSSVGAVLFANSFIGLLVLYPRQFPVLAQKFAFGGSTIALWGVYSGASPRWQPLGLPLSAAVGAVCALVVTCPPVPCSAEAAAQREAETGVALMEAALTDAVDAFTATTDRRRREVLRARTNNARRDAELRLDNLEKYAADARWERVAGVLWARVFPGGAARRRRDKQVHPEVNAHASTLSSGYL
jgi:hypothetical protein